MRQSGRVNLVHVFEVLPRRSPDAFAPRLLSMRVGGRRVARDGLAFRMSLRSQTVDTLRVRRGYGRARRGVAGQIVLRPRVRRGPALLKLDLVLPSALEVVRRALELGEAFAERAPDLWELARPEEDERHHRYHQQLRRPQELEDE